MKSGGEMLSVKSLKQTKLWFGTCQIVQKYGLTPLTLTLMTPLMVENRKGLTLAIGALARMSSPKGPYS
jgi:hypothetical protein